LCDVGNPNEGKSCFSREHAPFDEISTGINVLGLSDQCTYAAGVCAVQNDGNVSGCSQYYLLKTPVLAFFCLAAVLTLYTATNNLTVVLGSKASTPAYYASLISIPAVGALACMVLPAARLRAALEHKDTVAEATSAAPVPLRFIGWYEGIWTRRVRLSMWGVPAKVRAFGKPTPSSLDTAHAVDGFATDKGDASGAAQPCAEPPATDVPPTQTPPVPLLADLSVVRYLRLMLRLPFSAAAGRAMRGSVPCLLRPLAAVAHLFCGAFCILATFGTAVALGVCNFFWFADRELALRYVDSGPGVGLSGAFLAVATKTQPIVVLKMTTAVAQLAYSVMRDVAAVGRWARRKACPCGAGSKARAAADGEAADGEAASVAAAPAAESAPPPSASAVLDALPPAHVRA
jgi:hypothetical protein